MQFGRNSSLTSKMFGFKILGPFYVITRLFGLLLIREVSNKIGCPKKGKFFFYNLFVFNPLVFLQASKPY